MSFVPRSVGRGRGDPYIPNRGGARGANRGFRGRGYFVDRGGGGRARGMRGPMSMRGRGGGRGRGTSPVYYPNVNNKGPVKILHPDDPEHPNFLKDHRNRNKIEQLISEGRLDKHDSRSKARRSSRSDDEDDDPEDMDQKEEIASDEDQLYPDLSQEMLEKPPGSDKFSEEGLRITVENKGTELSVADPSFYDEILPRDVHKKSSKDSKLGKKQSDGGETMEYENISESDEGGTPPRKKPIQEKQTPKITSHSKHTKQNDESIRITVGNDKFKSRDSDKSSTLPKACKRESPVGQFDSRPLTEYGEKQKHSHVRRSRSRDRRRSWSPRRPGNRKLRSRSRSRGRKRSRSISRKRSRSRSRRRSRSRSRRRSTSRSRRRSTSRSRRRSRSLKRGRSRSSSLRRSISRSRRGSPRRTYKGRSRSRSLTINHGHGRTSRSSSYDSSSSSSSRSSKDQGPAASLPPKSKWEDSPQRNSRWDTSPPKKRKSTPKNGKAANEVSKSKVNPFMDYLKDLDYNKLSGSKSTSSALPWMEDGAKASDVLEIEKYLENKLKQAKIHVDGQQKEQVAIMKSPRTTQPETSSATDAAETYRPPKHEPHITKFQQDTVQKHQADIRGNPPRITPEMKEHSPEDDLYDDLPTQPRLTTPPVPAPAYKSILKQKVREASPAEPLEEQDRRMKLNDEASRLASVSQRKESKSGAVPGIASMMDIDDEDAFLYGDLDMPQPEAAAGQQHNDKGKRSEDESHADPVFTGGYTGEDPGWEVASAKAWPEPVSEDKHEQSEQPKKEEEAPVDPTIQNILKSIGFNFELSKLMQKKAHDERQKSEDVESYGIRQGSSFLSGGLKSSDIKSALNADEVTADAKKGKESRKASVDVKESYEERARRYREEEMKMYQTNPENELNQAEEHWENNEEISQPSNGSYYDQSQSYGMESHVDYESSHMDQYGDGGYEQHYSEYGEQGHYHQDGLSDTIRQSNLTVIQTVECDHEPQQDLDEQQRFSALEQLQDVYHEDERLRELENYKRGRGDSERLNSREGWDRENDWERDSVEESRIKQSKFIDGQKTSSHRHNSYDEENSFKKDQKRNNKDSNERDRKDSRNRGKEEYRRKDRESSHDSSYKKKSKDKSYETSKRKRSRSRSRNRSRSRSYDRISKRKDSSPKRHISKSKDEDAKRKKTEESPHSAKLPESAAVKIGPSANMKEREHLMYELEDRRSRMQSLDKELDNLKKQENELIRKQQRQKKGEKDKLLGDNVQLQAEIKQQMALLRSAAEVNVQLLLASRTGDAKDDQELMALITGQSKKVKKSRTLSPVPPPKVQQNKPPPEKKVPEKKASKHGDEKVKLKKMEVHYEYFDPGNHWCKQCNKVSSNCYEVFQHLQTKKHSQKLDPYERPWMPESLKNPVKPSMKGQRVTAAAPLRGVEFMMAVQAFYCTICKEFSGDMICAEEHLKSKGHNEKYQAFLDENQFYERQYNLDKAAGLSMAPTTDGANPDASNASNKNIKTVDELELAVQQSRKESANVMLENIRVQREERERLKARYEEQVKKSSERAEVRKKEASEKNRALSDRHRSQEHSVIELEDVEHSKVDSKGKSFGNFKWKGKAPMIGKAPGFKKSATSVPVSASDTDTSKISIKLAGKHTGSKLVAAPKVEIGRPIPLVGKKPTKRDELGPDPLDIFVTVSNNSKKQKTVPNPNLVDIALPKLPAKKGVNTSLPAALTKKPVTAKSKIVEEGLRISKEEQEDRKMLGIEEDFAPKVAPKPPPPMAQGVANRPEQSMAATSVKKMYGVFFGKQSAISPDGKHSSGKQECSGNEAGQTGK